MYDLIAIDIGNSKTKFGFFQDGQLIQTKKIPTVKNATLQELQKTYQDIFDQDNINPKNNYILIASVVPHITKLLATQKQFNFVTANSPIDFSILRTVPETLGADIIAGSQASIYIGKGPWIVVSAGTATTVTYINEKKEFLGGSISPGLGISLKALTDNASALESVTLNIPPSVLGNTTETAIASGLLYGHAGMIKSLISDIAQEEKCTVYQVILTGGAMPSLIPLLPKTYVFEPNLVLLGIHSLFNKRFSL